MWQAALEVWEVARPRTVFAGFVTATLAGAVALGCASAPEPSQSREEASAPESAPVADPAPPQAAEAAEPDAAADSGSAPEQEPGDDAEAKLAPLTEAEVQLGARFQQLADEFGLTQFVRARRVSAGGGYVFDYLPEGETLTVWRYRGSFRLLAVAATFEEGSVILPRFVEAFRERTSALNELETFEFPEGDVTFIDYELEADGGTNHNLAVVWQVYAGYLGIFEVHRKGARFEDWKVDRFRTVAQRLGRADRPPAETGETSE